MVLLLQGLWMDLFFFLQGDFEEKSEHCYYCYSWGCLANLRTSCFSSQILKVFLDSSHIFCA